MANWIAPAFTTSRVRAAGKRIRERRPNLEDLQVLENWRASHAFVLNTFQTNLRRRAKGRIVTVAQRLKRRATIFDKLSRESSMQLNTMHDIAGCRLIFEDENALRSFRESIHESRFRHVLKFDGQDRYNYILNPKPSGYRGIHDVYEYKVQSPTGQQWNGLHVEIQYRTIYQHAWATAVEAADLVTSSRIKFSLAEQRYERFFRTCSEIIARHYENHTSCLPDMTNYDLVSEFRSLENSTGLLHTLRNLKKSSSTATFKTNTLLIFYTEDGSRPDALEIETYENVRVALERYNQLEKDLSGKADIVLVRAESAENVRDAFRNYFSDANDFVTYIDTGVAALG